jgi:NAD(P)-dependent dehydrogenase (short-subunit alcohol dehydrogenase family)
MQPWALVSPASRGIGLELARRLLQTTKMPIVATARKDLDQAREHLLHGLDGVSEDRLHVLKIDVLGRSFVVLHLAQDFIVVQYATPSSQSLEEPHLTPDR